MSPVSQVVDSICPATGDKIASVVTGSQEDYERCAEAARAAWPLWASLPAPRRGEIVRRIGDALRQNLEPLGRIVSLEMGKLRENFCVPSVL